MYTQPQLDLMAELQVIANNVLNMEPPHDIQEEVTVAEARRYAAIELKRLGYSHRQIMKALGLKSPQSVSVYLKSVPSEHKTPKGDS